MMHSKRNWQVVDVAILELAQKLTEHTWCECSAFRTPGGTIWASDATSGDGAQEYGVLRRIGDKWQQVESITASWCTEAELVLYATNADEGKYDSENYATVPDDRIQTPEEHGTCYCCA